VPPLPPLLPPGGPGPAFPNPFEPPSDVSLPPQHTYQQFNYDSNDHNDPYQRPYSTHPPGTFSPPPAGEYDYAQPIQMQPPQPHTSYFEPHYGSEPQLTPPSTGYALQDDGVQPADEEGGDIPLLTRRRNYSESLGGPVPGAYEPSINDSASEVNIHYGRIPQRVPRRFKTTKKIQ
jgi:chitin synthase